MPRKYALTLVPAQVGDLVLDARVLALTYRDAPSSRRLAGLGQVHDGPDVGESQAGIVCAISDRASREF